jgi:hypothetical protein
MSRRQFSSRKSIFGANLIRRSAPTEGPAVFLAPTFVGEETAWLLPSDSSPGLVTGMRCGHVQSLAHRIRLAFDLPTGRRLTSPRPDRHALRSILGVGAPIGPVHARELSPQGGRPRRRSHFTQQRVREREEMPSRRCSRSLTPVIHRIPIGDLVPVGNSPRWMEYWTGNS